ncbi:flagellar assembly protein FliH [Dechloromonas sp. XY25]|uniref:Flagellar assembly protein FliH n=1 Tax=Dechloromonas hankyongensis TaxID=2908002 RepID=A0ABS9K6U2_9RHOO|nr:flagellar assembly protein FliH [Dechloromonas hankyongensis]MCG2578858.1 flagellar assembly protein FliH [Dechloromonas hankyongensis]
MSGIIPKEETSSFKRWQINSFDTPTSPPPSPEVEPPAKEPVAAAPSESSGDIAAPTAEEIENIYNEARTTGYQDGYDEGRQAGEIAGRESTEQTCKDLLALTANLKHALGELDQTIADHLLEVATEIAKQVVGGTITMKSDLLLPIIREAIAALPLHHAHIVVRLNPQDAAAVREHMGESFAQSGTQLIEDNDISRGGCLVRAGSSEVDATLETRWKRVLESIGGSAPDWQAP